MLLSDFLPRLQARAFDRYGVKLSERQFRDWRELGFIPGPAAPKGRGRGRSPDRHWPLAAYRRALRICRYKSRRVERKSVWWIMFWLSGEAVPLSDLKESFRRELRSARRRGRYLGESGFLRSKGDANRGMIPSDPVGDPVSKAVWDLVSSDVMGVPASIHRDFLRLSFEDHEPAETRRVFGSFIRPLMGHDITPEDLGVDLTEVWRPGHLSEGFKFPGDYIENSTEAHFDLARRIMISERLGLRLMRPNADLLGASPPASALFYFIMNVAVKTFGNPLLSGEALRLIYAIQDDLREGRNPERRLAFAEENIEILREHDEILNDREELAQTYAFFRDESQILAKLKDLGFPTISKFAK